MSELEGLILALPQSGELPLICWRIEDGEIAERAAYILPGGDEVRGLFANASGQRVMALLPSAETAIYFTGWKDLTPAQAIAAANTQIVHKAMGARDDIHVASALSLDQSAELETISATVSAQYLAHWLDELAIAGIDPDIVTPGGLILPATENTITRAVIGDDAALRSADAVFSDEEPLRTLLVGDADIDELSADRLDRQLLSAFADPPLNLRQGLFAKKRQRVWLTRQQLKRLAQMAAAVLLILFVTFLIQIGKYKLDEHAVRNAALVEAQQRFPSATDMAAAEQMVDEELLRRGLGQRVFSVPAIALFNAIEPIPSISARNLSYQSDGVVSVTLAAPRKEDIDAALLQLQRQGYQVSVPPALTNDATGSVVADGVKVWVP